MADDEAIQRLRDAERNMRSQTLHRFLHWLYRDEPVYARAGQIYPIAVFPAASSMEIESLLGPLDPATADGDLMRDPAFLDLIMRAGRHVVDLPTFTLHTLEAQDGKIRLHCGMGSYFQMLETCEALEYEMLSRADRLEGESEDAFRRFIDLLPMRRALHQRVTHPVRDASHRSAALGISTLVAFQHGGEIGLILRRRSAHVATGAGLLHIVPSFMFQPVNASVEAEYSIEHNIFREYLEELFGQPEDDARDAIYRDPRLMFLQELLATQGAELHLTGVTVSLLNLRLEICTLLLIRSDEWHTRHIGSVQQPADALRFSDEVSADPGEEAFVPIAFDASMPDDEVLRRAGITADRTVPNGAGAFWLGIDRLRAILKE